MVKMWPKEALPSDTGAVVDSTAGIGQGGYQAAFLAGETSRSHFGQGDMVGETRSLGTSPAHIQILVKLVTVNFCPKLVRVQVLDAVQVVRVRRRGKLTQMGREAAGSSGTHLVVVQARWVGSPHGIGQV